MPLWLPLWNGEGRSGCLGRPCLVLCREPGSGLRRDGKWITLSFALVPGGSGQARLVVASPFYGVAGLSVLHAHYVLPRLALVAQAPRDSFDLHDPDRGVRRGADQSPGR